MNNNKGKHRQEYDFESVDDMLTRQGLDPVEPTIGSEQTALKGPDLLSTTLSNRWQQIIHEYR